jgi:hypothetical protein
MYEWIRMNGVMVRRDKGMDGPLVRRGAPRPCGPQQAVGKDTLMPLSLQKALSSVVLSRDTGVGPQWTAEDPGASSQPWVAGSRPHQPPRVQAGFGFVKRQRDEQPPRSNRRRASWLLCERRSNLVLQPTVLRYRQGLSSFRHRPLDKNHPPPPDRPEASPSCALAYGATLSQNAQVGPASSRLATPPPSPMIRTWPDPVMGKTNTRHRKAHITALRFARHCVAVDTCPEVLIGPPKRL